ncbi:hypothetical protein COOONC_08927 [Cooperia oncophora]
MRFYEVTFVIDYHERIHSSDTAEFHKVFELTKTEILKSECLQNVTAAPKHHSLRVFSLNAMVQQGVKSEHNWSEARLAHRDLGMNYVDIFVEVYPIRRSTDTQTVKFIAQMRFRNSTKLGFEPLGTPFIYKMEQKCHTHRVDEYCEMCHYNQKITP